MGVQPRRGCGPTVKVWFRVVFGMTMIFILVREYGAYFPTKLKIVDLKSIKQEEESERESRRALGRSILDCSSVVKAKKKWLIAQELRNQTFAH